MASTIKVDKIAQSSGTPEFTIPTADGTSGQFIKTDASGVLSFGSAPALTGSTNTWIPTITGANALTGTANFTYDGNTLDVKNSGTASSVKLYCESSNAHYQAIKAAPHAGSSNWTLTLPPTVPSVSGQVLSATTAGVASWVTAGLFSSYAIISDSKASGTDGGTFTSGAWQTRDLQTEITDPDSIVSITTNAFTLAAGSYLIRWSAPCYKVNGNKTRLYDVTGTAAIQDGTTQGANSGDNGYVVSTGSARITPSGSNVYRIEHKCDTTAASNGFGFGISYGDPEVFTLVEIYKES